MTKINIGYAGKQRIDIDLAVLLRTRLLIQANSGGGKSYLLRRICEQAFGKVQIIVIDPEGEFATLRERFDFVLVGHGGETPADVRSAALVAHKLLELNASAVCDLYEMKVSQRHQWVSSFLEALIDSPKELWHSLLVIVDEAHVFCMDSATEVLSVNGWRKWNELRQNEDVVCFNPETGDYEYGAASRVIVREHRGKMISLQSDGIDHVVTPDHRLVIRKFQRAKGRAHFYPWEFCSAQDVPQHIYIPKGGAPIGNGVPNLSAQMARLLGWVITDGAFMGAQREKYKRYLSISQSYRTIKRGNIMVNELADMLSDLDFEGVSRYEREARTKNGKNTGPSVEFYLGRKLSARLLNWFGDEIHRIPREILRFGSRDQLAALYQGLLEGDGTSVHGEWRAFYAGLNRKLADDFLELAIRLGVSATRSFVPSNKQWVILLSKRQHHYIRKAKESNYNGIVWDITVPTGAFVARRNGKVFVTGNCPEKGAGESIASDAMIGLATRGRKRGFCAIFATQRLGKLRKDAAAELVNVLIGQTFIDVDRKRAADALGIPKSDERAFFNEMKVVEPGHFWALGRAITKKRLMVEIGSVETTHPEPGKAGQSYEPPPAPDKIKAMLSKLEDLPQTAERKARTEEELRSEVRSLTAKLAARPTLTVPEIQRVEVPVFQNDELERMQEIAGQFGNLGEQLATLSRDLLTTAKTKLSSPARLSSSMSPSLFAPPKDFFDTHAKRVQRPAPTTASQDDSALTGPEQRILDAIALFWSIGQEEPKQTGVAFLAGYTYGGGAFNNPRGRLRSKGLVTYVGGDCIRLTDEGRERANTSTPVLTVQEMQSRVFAILPRPEAHILQVLIGAYPRSMSKVDLSEITSRRGGAFNNPLGRLRTLGLIEYPQPGHARALPVLFLE